MEKVFVGGLGSVPAKKASDLRIGDRIIISFREMGDITNLEYHEEYVRIRVKDSCTHTDYSINKRKSNLVGILPKG